MLSTDRQTDRQTNQRYQKHNLLCQGGNKNTYNYLFVQGGMKAVMWTDSFQICMMFAGLIAVLVKGSLDNDGFANVWRINDEGGRIEFQE